LTNTVKVMSLLW